MLYNSENLQYIASITGKSVLWVFNDVTKEEYNYLLDEFKPANPSNHIFDTYFRGKDMRGILNALVGYSHGHLSVDVQSILTKIEDIPSKKYTFQAFRWIKFDN
jgi:hypothetical protein